MCMSILLNRACDCSRVVRAGIMERGGEICSNRDAVEKMWRFASLGSQRECIIRKSGREPCSEFSLRRA